MPSPTDDESPFPSLSHAAAFNAFGRSHLSPHDAHPSPPRRARDFDGQNGTAPLRGGPDAERSRSRRRKRAWKKLMWVKQSYPDNYTDQATFLENLQRNPRLKPYDFWPLVADSTIILQHVCSVTIFIVCFVGIFHARVSPVSVVSWSSFGTFVGWILWERWVSEEEDEEDEAAKTAAAEAAASTSPSSAMMAVAPIAVAARSASLRRRNRAGSVRRPPHPLRLESLPSSSTAGMVPASTTTTTTTTTTTGTTGTTATASVSAASSTMDLHGSTAYTTSNGRLAAPASTTGLNSTGGSTRLTPKSSTEFRHDGDEPLVPLDENRTHQRLGTIKSALLIYSTLLGLSPILKSLTRSTSSDSIWAMSFWLLAINIFFFDYSGGVGAKFPASLSTNAALMASTVLASRLPQTNQVFSLTLFSIEVFGLFPVFRRHVRHRSWRYHVLQTVVLVLGAGWGVGVVLGDAKNGSKWPWKSGIVGMIFSVVISALATGGCSWWLIGLQKYKNEIRGPWDPARPIIMSRTRWDDR